MIWEKPTSLNLALIIAISMFLASCSCGGKSGGGGGGEAPPPAADGTDDGTEDGAEDTADDSTDADDKPVIVDESIGEEVGPVEDDVAVIDTSTRAKLVHLPFISSDNLDAGKRHLSEFLVVIRAKEDSCTRFKIRPTSGVNDEVDDSLINSELADNGPCEDQIDLGENQEAGDGTDQSSIESEGLELRGFYDDLVWMHEAHGEAAAPRSFNLQNTAKELCDARLFRMPNNQDVRFGLPSGLDNVVTKTGRLLHIGSKVRIWLDEEYSNMCVAVSDPETGLNDRNGVRFGPLIQSGVLSNDLPHMDKLWYEHITNLGNEMDKIITHMTATYGAISDIDGTGKIEIFISPEVNRYYLNRVESDDIDHFRARLVFKPEDLAYYDVENNPSSNEGEILYLWAPDPAGIYNYVQFPSSNSIASNYAKGFLAAQVMLLVMANEKLFVQDKKEMEDRWLAEGLAGMVSAYYAGNDYTIDSLAQYLTSRSQFIPLVTELDPEHFTASYMINAIDEQFGMRVMFGWYLHARLCSGTSVAPCAKMKEFITQPTFGVDSVEKVLGEPLEKTLENFALSLGVSMMERPERAFAFWDSAEDVSKLPAKPYLLPDLMEIFPDDPRVTQESNKNLETADLVEDDYLDRTVAGPIPNKGALIYQPLTADQDLEFKIDDTAVTWVLVTSLVEKTTDATVYFGKGLNVVLVPLGDRDDATRLMVVEKTSENAHIDFRPVNLSQVQGDATKTYRYEPYLRDEDFSVTPDRELWVLGSIDNYNVNVGGSDKSGPDSDAYQIVWNPCRGLTGDDLVACQANEHDVLVQVYPRQFKSQLKPLVVVTDTDRRMFRGALLLGHLETDTAAERPNCDSPPNDPWCVLCAIGTQRKGPALTINDNSHPTEPNVLTAIGHGLQTGNQIRLTSSNSILPPPLELDDVYFVEVIDDDKFYVLNRLGAVIEIGAEGPHHLGFSATQVTFDTANPVTVTQVGHGLADNDTVFFTTDGNLPRPLMAGRAYRAQVGPDPDTYTLALEPDGNLVSTDIGTPTYEFYYTDNAGCGNGGYAGFRFYDDDLHRIDNRIFAHNFQNYLAMGPLGHPFTNERQARSVGPSCSGTRCFHEYEFERQFLHFNLNPAAPLQPYAFLGVVEASVGGERGGTTLSAEQVAMLAELKALIDDAACVEPDSEADEDFVNACRAFPAFDNIMCRNICTMKTQIDDAMIEYSSQNTLRVGCAVGACGNGIALSLPGLFSSRWVHPDNLEVLRDAVVDTWEGYYKALEHTARGGYCDTAANGGTDPTITCPMRQIVSEGILNDIRHQLYVPLEEIAEDGRCVRQLYQEDFSLCVDRFAHANNVVNAATSYHFQKDALPTDRDRIHPMALSRRAGEIIGKDQRMHYLQFRVRGDQETITNIMVGGQNLSTGKYLLRARFKDAPQ